VTVKLAEAVPVSGGLILELVTLDEKAMTKARRGSARGPSPRRKPGAAKAKAAADRRKVSRTRR
jgi:ribonuclease R